MCIFSLYLMFNYFHCLIMLIVALKYLHTYLLTEQRMIFFIKQCGGLEQTFTTWQVQFLLFTVSYREKYKNLNDHYRDKSNSTAGAMQVNSNVFGHTISLRHSNVNALYIHIYIYIYILLFLRFLFDGRYYVKNIFQSSSWN